VVRPAGCRKQHVITAVLRARQREIEMQTEHWTPTRQDFLGVAGTLALAALSACGSTNGDTSSDMTVLPDLVLADLKDRTYPAGPYAQAGAVNLGDVLPNFTFQGHWSPMKATGKASEEPFGEVSFGMMHDSGKRYALVQLAAFW